MTKSISESSTGEAQRLPKDDGRKKAGRGRTKTKVADDVGHAEIQIPPVAIQVQVDGRSDGVQHRAVSLGLPKVSS